MASMHDEGRSMRVKAASFGQIFRLLLVPSNVVPRFQVVHQPALTLPLVLGRLSNFQHRFVALHVVLPRFGAACSAPSLHRLRSISYLLSLASQMQVS